MRIILEFDSAMKPILAKMLSSSMNKIRQPSFIEKTKASRSDYMAAFTLMTKLDVELNTGHGDNVILKGDSDDWSS